MCAVLHGFSDRACFRVPVWCLPFALPLAIYRLCAVVLKQVMRRAAYTVCTLAVCAIVLLSFSPVALCFPWALVHLPRRPCDGTMGCFPPTSALSFQLSS